MKTALSLGKQTKSFNGRRLCHLALLAALPVSGVAGAQECNPVNFMSGQVVLETYSDKLAFLHDVSQENWGTSKQSISAGVTLPFEVPIVAQGDYDSFDKWRNTYFSHVKYTRDKKLDYVFHSSAFTPAGLQAYAACLSQKDNAGLSSFVTLTGNLANVHVSWKPGPKISSSEPDAVTILLSSNGLAAPLNEQVTLKRGGEVIRTAQLGETVPTAITATIVGAADVSDSWTEKFGTWVSAMFVGKPKIETTSVVADVLMPEVCRMMDVQRFEKTQWSTGYGDGSGQNRLPPWASTWRAALEKKGYKNVVVTYKGKDHEDSHQTSGWNWHWQYNYTGNYEANYTEAVPGPGCYGQAIAMK